MKVSNRQHMGKKILPETMKEAYIVLLSKRKIARNHKI